MMQLKPIQPSEREQLRHMAEAYWQELMPHADMVRDAEQRTRYFQERFPLGDEHHRVQWAMVDGQPVGFIAFTLDQARKQALVEDFYVVATERRRGYGAAMVRLLYQQVDAMGIELVELTVRRDNPQALAFWEAQGLRIAHYLMRQYRDPKTGQSFIGALSSDFR
jgi:ribosomal protein S18 acetylase RimI-like enzyme